ncbi:MAG: hypothetical protein JO317_07230 [Verrucomicrobiae bacterium]|nr:hypothetical protein [Verrucomicrobiae bacterium]
MRNLTLVLVVLMAPLASPAQSSLSSSNSVSQITVQLVEPGSGGALAYLQSARSGGTTVTYPPSNIVFVAGIAITTPNAIVTTDARPAGQKLVYGAMVDRWEVVTAPKSPESVSSGAPPPAPSAPAVTTAAPTSDSLGSVLDYEGKVLSVTPDGIWVMAARLEDAESSGVAAPHRKDYIGMGTGIQQGTLSKSKRVASSNPTRWLLVGHPSPRRLLIGQKFQFKAQIRYRSGHDDVLQYVN